MGAIVADELVGSVNNHLRGIDTVNAEAGAVSVLTFGELV
jgi:hypothetical protein